MVTHKYTLENKVYSTFTVTFGTELTSIVWCFTIGFRYFQNLEIINTRASKIWGVPKIYFFKKSGAQKPGIHLK